MPYLRLRSLFRALCAARLVHLTASAYRKTVLFHILRDGGARGDERSVAEAHGRDEIHVRPYETVPAHRSAVFPFPVVIAEHRPAPHVGAAAHVRVADVGEMRALRAVAEDGILDFDKVAHAAAFAYDRTAQTRKRSHRAPRADARIRKVRHNDFCAALYAAVGDVRALHRRARLNDGVPLDLQNGRISAPAAMRTVSSTTVFAGSRTKTPASSSLSVILSFN